MSQHIIFVSYSLVTLIVKVFMYLFILKPFSRSDIVYFREMKRWRWYVMTPFFVMWSKEYFKISWGWKQICLVWMLQNSKLRQPFNRCYAYLSLQRWNFLSSMEPLPERFNNNIWGVINRLFAILILEQLITVTI